MGGFMPSRISPLRYRARSMAAPSPVISAIVPGDFLLTSVQLIRRGTWELAAPLPLSASQSLWGGGDTGRPHGIVLGGMASRQPFNPGRAGCGAKAVFFTLNNPPCICFYFSLKNIIIIFPANNKGSSAIPYTCCIAGGKDPRALRDF